MDRLSCPSHVGEDGRKCQPKSEISSPNGTNQGGKINSVQNGYKIVFFKDDPHQLAGQTLDGRLLNDPLCPPDPASRVLTGDFILYD